MVLPTDTVYGLCATPDAAAAAALVHALKGRGGEQPTSILAHDVDALLECVPELSGPAAAIARALLPGPYTLVFANPARRYPWLTGSRPETIGVRVPQLTGDAREVLSRVGAVLATSANRHGGPDPRRLSDVPVEIRVGCGALVEGGELPGIASTVIDCTGDEPVVLREGAVSAADALARLRAATA